MLVAARRYALAKDRDDDGAEGSAWLWAEVLFVGGMVTLAYAAFALEVGRLIVAFLA